MAVILVAAMFVTFLMVEQFTPKKAPEYILRIAPRADRFYQVRAAISRRQTDRRGQASQSAA
jgi:hypothetical protein